jgi:DegV family protein with EDD domain
MAIEIYCDAGSNLYPKVLKEKNMNIHVMSMNVILNGKTYCCYDDDIDVEKFSKEYYAALDPAKKNVRTSLVSPGQFQEAFQKEVDAGNQVICFTMAKGISGTYQSACIAADMVNQDAGKEVVHVINSATAGFGEGMQAMYAYENAQKGLSFEEVVQRSEDYVFKVRSEFTVDDIRYLSSTGRVSPLVAKIANLLRIKVMLKGSNESTIVLTKKVHGRKMSLKNLVTTCLEKITDKNSLVLISHCDCEEDALSVKKGLEEGGVNNVEIYPYDIVTGAHVGPGCVAIFYLGENRD